MSELAFAAGAYQPEPEFQKTSNVHWISQRKPQSFSSAELTEHQKSGHWVGVTIEKICQFLDFNENWDSYGAPPIDPQLGMFVIQILNNFMNENITIPKIFPSSVGGIQLEWRDSRYELELHIPEPYTYEYLLVDKTNDQEKEEEFTDSNLTRLTSIFEKIAEIQ